MNAGGVDDCRQGDLAGGVDQEGVSQEDRVQELVNVRPPGVHLVLLLLLVAEDCSPFPLAFALLRSLSFMLSFELLLSSL